MTIPEYHRSTGNSTTPANWRSCAISGCVCAGAHRTASTASNRSFPIDLRTRQQAEYLVFEDLPGRRRFLRLDRIVGASAFFMHRPETGTH